jgi:hypothetical protein
MNWSKLIVGLLKYHHHRPYGDAFFTKRGRVLLIEDWGQKFNGIEKGKIRKDVRDIETKEPADPNIVSWDGDNDPANPLNWSAWSKWMNVSILAVITFIV